MEQNVMLLLKEAPFDKRDAELVPAAGSCLDCPKRTGHNKLLFADVRQDACTDPACYQAKVDAHVAKAIAAKPQLVQISTAYAKQQEGSPVLPRNKYVAIRDERPKNKEEAQRPEYKTCKYTTEAIIAEGSDKGEMHKVCAHPDCNVHHPKKQPSRADTSLKAQQDQERREAAIASATGIYVLTAIAAAVPVRLMKRDLLFVAERLASLLDQNRLTVIARQHGIKKAKDSDSIGKLFAAWLRRAEESTLGAVLVEIAIVSSAARNNAAQVLRDAAALYKVDVDAITAKVKQDFAAKEKAKAVKKAAPKPPAKHQAKTAKKQVAA
jgi:ParB family chromosome partitioning protein